MRLKTFEKKIHIADLCRFFGWFLFWILIPCSFIFSGMIKIDLDPKNDCIDYMRFFPRYATLYHHVSFVLTK